MIELPGSTAAWVLARSGVVRPFSPLTLLSLGKALWEWGTGVAGGFRTLAVRYPDRVGIVDDSGTVTFGELDRRSNALARGLAARGVGPGDRVALLLRNHRYFVDALVAVAKLGADPLLLNTSFAGPTLVDVVTREGAAVAVYDAEFAPLLRQARLTHRVVAWPAADPAEGRPGRRAGRASEVTVEALIDGYDDGAVHASPRTGRVVIMTSGTTGAPKGAARSSGGIEDAVAMLSRLPLREGWRTHVAAPLFHTWGLAHLLLGTLLGSTVVLRRRFDPEECLALLEDENCKSLAVVPVMLRRILALPDPVLSSYGLTRVRVVAASGSALPGDLATRWMDRFGDTLYNVYGSTEVAYASIASPADLRAAPGTAGRPPAGTVLRILDDDGDPVPDGATGRIAVRNPMLFDGYTTGGGRELVDGLMPTGDLGHVDQRGLLFVDGRVDDMVVSGGENVYPREVEDCLAGHPAVRDVAVIGVEDADFGARLAAFVVTSGDTTPDPQELQDWVRDRLARYKVPARVIELDQLPRNATGKVISAALRERLA